MAHHDFWLKFNGIGNDALRPYADIQFKTGVGRNAAGLIKPSLTDDEAIALFDKLTSSIRVRPTSVSTKTSEADSDRLPLGALAVTGRTCPQTGWWECDHPGEVLGGRRQLIHVDEPMPHVVYAGDPSLWQRLRGDQPSYRAATMWKLVGYASTADTPGLPQPKGQE